MQLKPDDVVLFHGANMALLNILQASCDEGDNILVPEIGYPFYEYVAPAYGVEVRKYKQIKEKNW